MLKKRILRAEMLEIRQLMAASVFEVEPNDIARQATSFSLPESGEIRLEGVSTSSKDKDFFRFEAPATGVVTTGLSVTGAKANLEVESARGQDLLELEHGANKGQFAVEKGQTYYVRLRSDSGSAASTYVTTLSFGSGASGSSGSGTTDPTPPGGAAAGSSIRESESNDTKSTANSFALAADAKTELLGSTTKDDKDFFAAKAAADGSVVLTTSGKGVKVSVESRLGIKLLETEPKDGVTTGRFAVEQGETYFIRVRGTDAAATDYSVALNHTSDPLAPAAASSADLAQARKNKMDVNGDDSITPIDVLTTINFINRAERESAHDAAIAALDINDDGNVGPIDALVVINQLNRDAADDHPSASDSTNQPTEVRGRENEAGDDRGGRGNEAGVDRLNGEGEGPERERGRKGRGGR